jgi:large subunit ribosomal protein L4
MVSGKTPSTKDAVAALRRVTESRHVLVVVERSDELTWKSVRNIPTVHLLEPGQLNTYDVLISDDVVFTQAALEAFLGGSLAVEIAEPESVADEVVEEQPAKKAAAKKATAKKAAAKKAPAKKAAAETASAETVVAEEPPAEAAAAAEVPAEDAAPAEPDTEAASESDETEEEQG